MVAGAWALIEEISDMTFIYLKEDPDVNSVLFRIEELSPDTNLKTRPAESLLFELSFIPACR